MEKEKEKFQLNPGEVGRQKPELAVDEIQKLKDYGRTQGQKKTTIEALSQEQHCSKKWKLAV